MFKTKKITKYAFSVIAIAFAFVIFIATPNSAKAGDDYGYYMGMGSENFDYSYSEPSYSFEDTSYYPDTTSYYPDTTSYYPDTTYYQDTTSYYNEPSYSSYSGCSSCSSGGGYSYVPSPKIVYVPSTPTYYPVQTPVYTPVYNNNQNQNQNYNYNNNNQNQNYNYNNNGYNYNYTNLTATCSAQPTNANVGDNVVWTVYPYGGNGSYTYNWTGSDSLSYGNAYQIQQRYATPGTKTATVTVYSTNGQSVTANCSANVIGSIISGTPISGVYLSEVPATGISFNLKVALYLLGLILWSAFVGFMIVEKKKTKFALANRSKIEDFKQENLRKKGLI